jgi:hypothetical protein
MFRLLTVSRTDDRTGQCRRAGTAKYQPSAYLASNTLGLWFMDVLRAYYRTAGKALDVARKLRERNIPNDIPLPDGWGRPGTEC